MDKKVIHFGIPVIGNTKIACGQGDPGLSWSYDPEKRTCRACKKTKAWKKAAGV